MIKKALELMISISCNFVLIAVIWWHTAVFGAIPRWWVFQRKEFCFWSPVCLLSLTLLLGMNLYEYLIILLWLEYWYYIEYKRVVLQQWMKRILILFLLTVGYQLEVQMLMLLGPALFVNVHLMITLLAAGVLTAECLFWFVVVARYDLIMYILSIIFMPTFSVCMSEVYHFEGVRKQTK